MKIAAALLLALLARPNATHFHMRRQLDDLREIPRLLVAGDLDGVRARGWWLSRPSTDPGLRPWSIEAIRLADAGRELARAPDLAEACRRSARVALACGECHAHARRPTVAGMPPPPAGVRHGWAADRLLDSIIAGSPRMWRAGLDALATTPPDAPRLRELAGAAIQRLEAQRASLDERARAYGDILVECTRCHANLAARSDLAKTQKSP